MSTIVMPDFSLNLAKVATIAVDRDHFHNISRENAETLTLAFASLYQEVHKGRVALENILEQGMNLYGISAPRADVDRTRRFGEQLAKVVGQWDSADYRASAPSFVQAIFVEAKRLLTDLRFIIEVDDIIAEASSRPPTPLDPHKAQAAWEAFERGETRPLRKDFLTGPR